MGKYVGDEVLDAAFAKIATADQMIACSAQPTTYAEATSTYKLAAASVTGADFTNANDTSGRKTTVAAKSGVSVTASGTANHIALVDAGLGLLLYVTTCASQALTSGNTADFPSWKINLQDPV